MTTWPSIRAIRIAGVTLVVLCVFVAADTSWARDKNLLGSDQCICFCNTGTVIRSSNSYDNHGLPCGAFNNKTCNAENPETHLIQGGKTEDCSDKLTVDVGHLQVPAA